MHWETKELKWLSLLWYSLYCNAEFKRIDRWDKKAFLNEQCKEIEENNRMGKIRDVFKKIGVIKGSNVS